MGRRKANGTSERLVQLPVQCSECGKREARRVAESRLKLYEGMDPEKVLETVKCKCGNLYVIKARAYQEATA